MSQTIESRISEILARAAAEIVQAFRETPPAMWADVRVTSVPPKANGLIQRTARGNLDRDVERVRQYLETLGRKHPGAGLTLISQNTGLDKDTVSRATSALVRTGEAKRKGEKRGTKYVLS